MSNALVPTAGPFAPATTDGVPVCHGRTNRKGHAPSRLKRQVRDEFFAVAALAGMVDSRGWVLGIDMVHRPMSDALTADRASVNERGHIVPDSHAGALCVCNLAPEPGHTNASHGDTLPEIDPRWDADAWRAAVRTVVAARVPATKRARLI